eukprot:206895_1
MRPTVICGPSGVGKRKLIEKLQQEVPDTFAVAVSHTTRTPKPNETDGIHYWFIDQQQFDTKTKEKNFFVEHVVYDTHCYGTSLPSINGIKRKHLICILDIDVFGAEQIKTQSQLDCNYLFITTSNGLDTLKKRLMHRHTESTQEINRRLEAAKTELQFIQNNPNFFDAVIYNDKDMDETFFNLKEQLIAWYPNLRRTIVQNGDVQEKKTIEDDHEDLANVLRITMCSKRQSLDIYADFNKDATFVTQEALCKDILYDNTPLEACNESIIDIICAYTDIPPRNRRAQWNMNEYSMILNKVTSNVQHRWTLGNSMTYYPIFNINTISDIYFAYHEKVMNGVLFYLCGTVQCPIFAKKYFKARIKSEKDWDKCWDIYFYMKCDSEYRGSVQFATQWSNMLIFGIDSDAIRQAVETGVWKLNTMQSNNFLIKASVASSVGTIDDDEDDQIVDLE